MTAPAFSCPRDVLRSALERVAKIVEKRNTVPVLSNVRLDVDQCGTLRIEGTDLVLSAATSTDTITLLRPGTTTVAADMLLASVKRMPEGTITVDADETTLTVKAGRARAKLPTLPSVDYPSITHGEPTHRFTIPAVDLTTIADKCGFAMSKEDTRYYLCGVFLHTQDGHLIAISVDGKRLSKLRLDCPEGADGMPGLILPDKMIQHFGLLTEKSDVPVKVELSERFIRFTAPQVSITCRPIDGTFPAYDRLIPRDNKLIAEFHLETLQEAVERLSIFATSDDRTMAWDFANDTLLLTGRSEVGEASEEIEVECDFTLRIGFNAKYMLDHLKTCRGPKIRMAFADPSSAPLLTDLGDDRREGLLMPLRV